MYFYLRNKNAPQQPSTSISPIISTSTAPFTNTSTTPVVAPSTGPATSSTNILPTSLMAVDNTKTINVDSNTVSMLAEDLYGLLRQSYKTNSFTRVVILYGQGGQTTYMSLKDIFADLKIAVPQTACPSPDTSGCLNYLMSNIDPNTYTLFIYSDSTGNRLGMVAKYSNLASLQSLVALWSSSMPSDAQSLLGPKVQPASSSFISTTYNGTPIMFMNFPSSSLSVDYGFLQSSNLFLIATSKNSMFEAIDRIAK